MAASKLTTPRRPRSNGVPIAILAKALRVPRTHRLVHYAWELDDLRWDDPPIEGIYAIVDTLYGDVYIGQTNDVYRRRRSHDSRLRRGTHPNYYLQHACPLGIDGRRWRFLVLENEFESDWHRRDVERRWHRRLPQCINVLNEAQTWEFRALRGYWRMDIR